MIYRTLNDKHKNNQLNQKPSGKELSLQKFYSAALYRKPLALTTGSCEKNGFTCYYTPYEHSRTAGTVHPGHLLLSAEGSDIRESTSDQEMENCALVPYSLSNQKFLGLLFLIYKRSCLDSMVFLGPLQFPSSRQLATYLGGNT